MLPSSVVIITALASQFIYILVNRYFFRRPEYVFYLFYLLVLTAYFLNKYLADEQGIVHFPGLPYSKLVPDKALAILSYIFYFKFGRHFVEAATRYPVMNRVMQRAEKLLYVYIGADLLLLLAFHNVPLANTLFLIINTAVFGLLVYIFAAMIRRNEALDRFILTGSLFYAVCACITFWLGQNKPPLEDNHIAVLQAGALLEMVWLNAGLVYKSKRLQQKTIFAQEQLIQQYRENQALSERLSSVRERLSRDLHDDVGATLSSIKAYAEILGQNGKDEVIRSLIKDNAADMIDRLEVIAWATNPQHDNFKSLTDAVLRFARPLTHAHNINFVFKSDGIDGGEVGGAARQQLFLICKEALNNTVKYAEATECRVGLSLKKQMLMLEITDNGKGCDGTIKGSGNGIRNMRKRAAELGGEMILQSANGEGTTIRLTVPLP